MRLYSREDVKDIDFRSTQEFGIPSLLLMEQAGEQSLRCIQKLYPEYRTMGILIFCGPGNNGGDASVLARKLFLDNARVEVIAFEDISKSQGDKAVNFSILQKLGVKIHILDSPKKQGMLSKLPENFQLAVDGLFGISFHGVIGSPFSLAVQAINQIPHVISLDIPSGISDAAIPEQIVVKAEHTFSFGGYKASLADFPAKYYCGTVHVLDIGFPPALLSEYAGDRHLVTTKEVKELIRPRSRDSHKGDFGHILLIGGSPGMRGAQVQMGLAALRAGAGLVTLAVPWEERHIGNNYPEMMLLTYEEIKEIPEFLEKRNINTVAAGPGWGQGVEQQEILIEILSAPRLKNLILDADALNIIARFSDTADLVKQWPGNKIFTPHIKEFSRLTGRSIPDIKSAKETSARDFSAQWQSWLLLKDSITLLCSPQGKIWYIDEGDCTLAKGGSGDILAGLIAGLNASGYNPEDACILGTYLLGRSGRLYSEKYTSHSALGRDILAMIPQAWKFLAES